MKPAAVLHSVSLEVARGRLFGFVGANGAGKTTLIQLIVGIRAPTAGTIQVSGFDARSYEARRRIGYLPERPYFHEHLNGEQTLLFFGALNGLSRQEILPKVEPILTKVGLIGARKTELRKYSKGMLQRMGVAQAILHDPELLVLDEPMSGLDPLGRKEMKALIRELSAEGKTVFFSSHVIPDVESLCDEVAWIQNGRILGCAPVEQMLRGRVLRYELHLRPWDPEKVQRTMEGAGLSASCSIAIHPDGMKIDFMTEEEAERALGVLLAAGARVREFSPVRPSLEDVFGEDFYRREERRHR